MKYIMGIDPGQSGALAVLEIKGEDEIYTLPFKNETDRDIITTLINIKKSTQPKCYIENVHTMPKQGIVSAGKFMKNFGLLIGALYAIGFVFEFVAPQVWQRSLKCLSKGNKNVTKTKAQQLFPGIKVTHAIADALLIAEYGKRIGISGYNAFPIRRTRHEAFTEDDL